ncbi:cell wall hydrolase [Sphingomonas sp. Leaf339]|uniref:cell wall hydrolase n=1 Tax=Sphingomonas sp. Leaf339 TaxID=1736343 RepID=UPI0006FB037E|nr:cell wall hydrolase [Sphingomonas sp. Leaf339]KQU52988.1 cell wall hydrolase [Sphingomonas sp. Leaf339]
MSFASRVASFAAMSFSLVALIGTSTPGWANGLDRSLIATPTLATLNTLAPHVVPDQIAPGATVEPEVPVPDVDQPVVSDDDDNSYDSLAEAVADQDTVASNDAMRCLAGAIYFESKGEPLSGQLAVAQVIINRAKSGRFPTDVCAVVKQRGQFSFVRGGQIPSIDEARRTWQTAVAVARVALSDAWDSVASEALYFNAHGRSPGARMQRVAAIGGHTFYR